jgi:tetratricopeptide (TPR) repeat protein
MTDDIQMALGDAFIDDGEYYRAITEYKKLIVLFPASERLAEAHYNIGMAYFRGGEYAFAASSFADVRKAFAADYFSSAAFYEGLSYRKLGRLDAAETAFIRSRLFDEMHPVAASAQLGLSLNAFEQGDVQRCRAELERFMVNYSEDERLPGVEASFRLLDGYESTTLKSPSLAGTLSAVLPGSGHVYAQRYKDGAMAFIVNALFIAGTVVAINDENYALAAIVGGVGLPFYVGNVYGAANAARKWNLSLKHDALEDLSISLQFNY